MLIPRGTKTRNSLSRTTNVRHQGLFNKSHSPTETKHAGVLHRELQQGPTAPHAPAKQSPSEQEVAILPPISAPPQQVDTAPFSMGSVLPSDMTAAEGCPPWGLNQSQVSMPVLVLALSGCIIFMRRAALMSLGTFMMHLCCHLDLPCPRPRFGSAHTMVLSPPGMATRPGTRGHGTCFCGVARPRLQPPLQHKDEPRGCKSQAAVLPTLRLKPNLYNIQWEDKKKRGCS